VSSIQGEISYKKALLGATLAVPMQELADDCAAVWDDLASLDEALRRGLTRLRHCHLLYALDTAGTQVSANTSLGRLETSWRGQNLSHRPYLVGSLPFKGFILSSAYLSQRSMEPCITAVQAIKRGEDLLGFVAADFNIRDLPFSDSPNQSSSAWKQFKGDPAIRGTLFMQQRVRSLMDERLDDVISIMDSLLRYHGIFHGKLHFSSSRFTLWHIDDPYNYRLHGSDEITSPEVCMAYRQRPYPNKAVVHPDSIRPALERFKELREADETVYLRSGSINVMNGMIGLNFSCDGTHYMSVDEFLGKELGFWTGTLG
jgi:hypothetical protein